MKARSWVIGGCACLSCGAVGFALGERHLLLAGDPPPAPHVAKAPVPVVLAPCPVTVPEDGGPPPLPVKVALTEPKLGEGLFEPPRRSPPDRNRHDEEPRAPEPPAPNAQEELADALRAQGEAQARQMAEMATQLQELKAQLASAQQSQQGHDDDAEAEVAAHRQALGALQHAQSALALGSTDIEGDLAQAEGSLSQPASAAISKARQALENDDLYAARQYLQQAMAADTPGAAGPTGTIPAVEGHGRR